MCRGYTIALMRNPAKWKLKDGAEISDADLADMIELDRSQVSRIRRRRSGTSKPVAQKLEQLTGIPWHEFIEPGVAA